MAVSSSQGLAHWKGKNKIEYHKSYHRLSIEGRFKTICLASVGDKAQTKEAISFLKLHINITSVFILKTGSLNKTIQ